MSREWIIRLLLPVLALALLLLAPRFVTGDNSFNSSTVPLITMPNDWVFSYIIVPSFPAPYYLKNWNVEVSVTLNLTHTNPENLIIVLSAPQDWSAYIGYYSSGANGSCMSYYVTTVRDNGNMQNWANESNPDIVGCPPPHLTAVGTLSTDFSLIARPRSQTLFPFANTLMSQPLEGNWTLKIYSDSNTDNGILNSWTLNLTTITLPGSIAEKPFWFVTLAGGLAFFVISGVFLAVRKGKEFLWFTSLPNLGFYVVSFGLEISGMVTYLVLFLPAMMAFDLGYNVVCFLVIAAELRTKTGGKVRDKDLFRSFRFWLVAVLALVHPANINCLALFDSSLAYEALQLGSAFSLSKLPKSVIVIIYCSLIVFGPGLPGGSQENNPFSLYIIYLNILIMTCFTLVYDIVFEVLKWRVVDASTVGVKVLDDDQVSIASTSTVPKGPTVFGERPLDLVMLNDPGSADRAENNDQYRRSGSVGSSNPRKGVRKESKTREPFLEDLLTEEPVDDQDSSDTSAEPLYSRIYAWVFSPVVLLCLLPQGIFIVSYALIRVSFLRYQIAFGGQANAQRASRGLHNLSFAASRGLFLFPLSFLGVLFSYLAFFIISLVPHLVFLMLGALASSLESFPVFLPFVRKVRTHANSHQAALLFVSSCMLWTFMPFMSSLPSFSLKARLVYDWTKVWVAIRLLGFLLVSFCVPLVAIITDVSFALAVSDPLIYPPRYTTIFLAVVGGEIIFLMTKMGLLVYAASGTFKVHELSFQRVGLFVQNPFAEENFSAESEIPKNLSLYSDRLFLLLAIVSVSIKAHLWLVSSLDLGFVFYLLSVGYICIYIPRQASGFLARGAPWGLRTTLSYFFGLILFTFFLTAALLTPDACVNTDFAISVDDLRMLQLCQAVEVAVRGSSAETPISLNFTRAQYVELVFENNTGVSSLDFDSLDVALQSCSPCRVSENRGLAYVRLQIAYCSENFLILSNPNLTMVSLPSLWSINGHLVISHNPRLDTVDLRTLQVLNGRLSVSNNAALTDLTFPNLQRIGGKLVIESNSLSDTLVFPLVTYIDPKANITIISSNLGVISFPGLAFDGATLDTISCSPSTVMLIDNSTSQWCR